MSELRNVDKAQNPRGQTMVAVVREPISDIENLEAYRVFCGGFDIGLMTIDSSKLDIKSDHVLATTILRAVVAFLIETVKVRRRWEEERGLVAAPPDTQAGMEFRSRGPHEGRHDPVAWRADDAAPSTWYAVPGNSATDDMGWTISPRPDQAGWETDGGREEYGLPRFVAESLARRLSLAVTEDV